MIIKIYITLKNLIPQLLLSLVLNKKIENIEMWGNIPNQI